MRDGGQRTSQFFEVLRQYKDFALIVKTDPLAVKKKIGVAEALGGSYERNRVVTSYATTIYFVNDNLGVRPYLEHQTKDVSHFNKLWNWDYFLLDGQRTRLRVIDKHLPKDVLDTLYEKVDDYADKGHLYWDVKDDLIQILDYYETLLDN